MLTYVLPHSCCRVRVSNQRKANRINAAESAKVVRVTDADRKTFATAPALTLKAPRRYQCDRGSTCRQMKLAAHNGWRYVMAHFDDVRLDNKAGSYVDALEDYGSFKAKLTFDRDAVKHGVRFMGTPFYDKKSRRRESDLKSNIPHREFIQAVFTSLATTFAMQLINPRVGLFQGASTAWHVDSNPRGAHPNALRPLERGFGVELYNGVQFRCSLLLWKDTYIIPLDLNPISFRYIWWPGSSAGGGGGNGGAEIYTADPSEFWDGIVAAGPVVVGSLLCSVINFQAGTPLTCPLDHTDIRTCTAELDALSFEKALSTARANPIPPPTELWTVIGDDPDRWDVFYAWRNPHRSVGNGAVRRVHVFSAALRQNPVGQFRSVPAGPPVERPIDPKRAEILALQLDDLIQIRGARGVPRRGLVIRVQDALEVCDMIVTVLYEDEEGCMCIERPEHLGWMQWERVALP